ncbi:MAG: SLBB domain-containing protein [Gemmatimonadaceae bacterium]
MKMSSGLWRRSFGAALIGLTAVAPRAAAQSGLPGASSEMETRPMLEAEMRKAEAQHRTAEAWLLKTRLDKGDFQDGDRIVMKLLGPTQLLGATGNDTIIVRAGRMLPIPQMADMPLTGVLRSELTDRLTHHLAQYLRDSTVRATPLIRLAVLGQVRMPNYYYTSADVLLSDMVMKAGGPNPTADVNNMVIRRGGEVIWNAQDTRTALADGLSLDRLHLRAGDELYVDQTKGGVNWQQVLQIVGPIVGLLSALRYYTR